MEPLPIDSHLPEILAALRATNSLVLTAPPGAGKTTRIPRMLYEEGFAAHGEILILEPRRLAARLAAARVAEELGQEPGGTVGYTIRFENVGGPQTRIRFLTEAILTRRIIHNPNLPGVSVVILDEFHERHLTTDLALALLKRLQIRNSQLKILVMSATLDVKPLAAYLPAAHTIELAEARYALHIQHEKKPDSRPVHEKVVSGVLQLMRAGIRGHILVFLPGLADIRRSADSLRPFEQSAGFTLALLHGDLPAAEQRSALAPSAKTKVILSTNVAETSVTIPGIAAVIDSGLARIAGHSAWSGFPTLSTQKISKSSATQRAGRAGRTQAGQVLRLYTESDFNARQAQETPEIRRTDLTETALMLHGAGIHRIRAVDWFEPPADPAMEAAESLLAKLGALEADGRLSPMGQRMLQLPVHPRIARLMLEAERLQVAEAGALLAALISERDIRLDARAQGAYAPSKASARTSGPSDLLELLDRFREAEQAHFQSERMPSLGLDFRAVHSVRQAHRQLRRLMLSRQPARTPPLTDAQQEEALLMAVLSAYPDRVARRRRSGSRELLLAGGGAAQLSPMSVVQNPMFMVAVDVEERKESAAFKPSGAWIRMASAIEIEWLAGLFPEKIAQTIGLGWNEAAGRVEEVRQTSYEQVVLEETVRTALPSEEASRILADAVQPRAASIFRDYDALAALQARLDLLAKIYAAESWPQIGDLEIQAAVWQLCGGKRSLAELAAASLMQVFHDQLTSRQRALLAKETPERFTLQSGRSVRIHYESAKGPWIESRLQDFFGTRETPRICTGKVALTLHLLAPNQRAVQVTQDLEGFWQRHYPSIRRELMRRYPRHAWPEKP